MIKNYDYRTPRDRVDPVFKARLENDAGFRPAGVFHSSGAGDCGCQNVRQYDLNNSGCRGNKSGCNLSGDCPLAMIYSPCQEFENLYEPNEALVRGSLFKDLDFPFRAYCCGGKGGRS